jgi:hypothetical protein
MRSNLRGWIFNTSTTGSFSFQHELFHDYTPVTPGDQSIKLNNHHTLAIEGHGTIHTFTYVKGRQVNIVLHDITHVPSLRTNILSPNALLGNGFIITLVDGGCEVRHQLALHPLFHIEQVDGLLIVPLMARPAQGRAAINHAAHTATPPCADRANQSTLSDTDSHLVDDDDDIPSLDKDSDSEGEDDDLIVSHADGTGKLLYHDTSRIRHQHGADAHYDEHAHHTAQRGRYTVRPRPTARPRAQLAWDKRTLTPSGRQPRRPINKGPARADSQDTETQRPRSTAKRVLSLDELHRQLGHASEDRLRKAAANLADIQVDARTTLSPCIPCIQGKQHRKAAGRGPAPRASRPWEMIHSDVCSPFPVQSFQGKQYFVLFIDDYSCHATVYFICKKSEVPAMFKLFNNTVVPNHACVCVLQSDNGREYIGNKFSDYLCNIGIQFEPAPAYMLQYNGVAERFNQMIGEMACTMILGSTLPKSFWAKAVAHAVDTNNCLLTWANKDRLPLEMLHGHPPWLGHLHPFSACCFLFLHEDHWDKLSAKSHEVVYLGTQGTSDVYQLWVPVSCTSTMSCNVVFATLDLPPLCILYH